MLKSKMLFNDKTKSIPKEKDVKNKNKDYFANSMSDPIFFFL